MWSSDRRVRRGWSVLTGEILEVTYRKVAYGKLPKRRQGMRFDGQIILELRV